jgi:hypothetical protein
MKLCVFVCWAACGVALIAQASKTPINATGAADAKGTCNAVASGNNNVFKIECGIGKDQGRRILEALNALLADKSTVNRKLDQILLELIPRAPVIAILEQHAVPAGKRLALRPDGTDSEGDKSKMPGASVTAQVQGDLLAPIYRVTCDHSCSITALAESSVGFRRVPPRTRRPFADRQDIIDVEGAGPLRAGDIANILVRSDSNETITVLGVAAILDSLR